MTHEIRHFQLKVEILNKDNETVQTRNYTACDKQWFRDYETYHTRVTPEGKFVDCNITCEACKKV